MKLVQTKMFASQCNLAALLVAIASAALAACAHSEQFSVHEATEGLRRTFRYDQESGTLESKYWPEQTLDWKPSGRALSVAVPLDARANPIEAQAWADHDRNCYAGSIAFHDQYTDGGPFKMCPSSAPSCPAPCWVLSGLGAVGRYGHPVLIAVALEPGGEAVLADSCCWELGYAVLKPRHTRIALPPESAIPFRRYPELLALALELGFFHEPWRGAEVRSGLFVVAEP